MRHGKAEPYAQTDTQRPLTPEGRQKIAAAAQALKKAGYQPDLLLCSPLLRARQSAQIASEILGVPAQTEALLDGRLSAHGLLDFAQKQLEKADCVILVGHNPNVSLASGILQQEYISLSAGGYAVFDWTDAKQPKLLLGRYK